MNTSFETPEPKEEKPSEEDSLESRQSHESEERLETEAGDLLETAKMIGAERGDSEFPKELAREVIRAKEVVEKNPNALPLWQKAVLVGTLAMSLFAAAPTPDAEARGMQNRPTQEQIEDRRNQQRDRWRFQAERRQQEESRWRHQEQGLRHEETERYYAERQFQDTARRIDIFGYLIGRTLGEILR